MALKRMMLSDAVRLDADEEEMTAWRHKVTQIQVEIPHSKDRGITCVSHVCTKTARRNYVEILVARLFWVPSKFDFGRVGITSLSCEAMFSLKKALVVLALAATASTTASAFIPGGSVKNVVSNFAKKGARFPLAAK